MRNWRRTFCLLSMQVALTVSAFIVQSQFPAAAAEETFGNYAAFESSSVPQSILWNVLARAGKSKTYTQVFALDGGTVGIANFAVGGLAGLYKLMDTQEYFGRSKEVMIKDYSNKCRPQDRSGNDTGWGCYSQMWWRDGMIRFVHSPDSKDIQKRAWLSEIRPTVELALAHGWTDSRSLAIATGIANSMGGGGFQKLAARNGWQSERVLAAYAGNDAHRKRRRAAINATFPH